MKKEKNLDEPLYENQNFSVMNSTFLYLRWEERGSEQKPILGLGIEKVKYTILFYSIQL